MPNNNQSEEVERIVGEIEDNIKTNCNASICSNCAGGGYDYEDSQECKKCNASGITNWDLDYLNGKLKTILTAHGASEYARGKREERGKQKYNVKEYDEVVYILKSSGGKTYEASIPPLKWYEMGKLGLRTYKALSQENTLKE